jgi:hypothetical protein
VEPRRDHDEGVADNPINETVLFGDTTRPCVRGAITEKLGFANPSGWISQGIADEPIDALEGGAVMLLPPEVVIPPMVVERENHDGSVLDEVVRPIIASLDVLE